MPAFSSVPVPSGDGAPRDAHIHYVGRWDTSSDATYSSYWGGAYLKTTFTGTRLKLKLGASANIYVSIDGGEDVFYQEANGIIDLTPSPLSNTSHTLRITARSEWDSIRFQGLLLEPGASTLPSSLAPLSVEFIGDSITSGLTDSKSTLTAFSWLTGEQLHVEHTQIAFSGICLVEDVYLRDEPGMSTQFFKERTVLQVDSPAWDFSRFQPNVVVINLGTNDNGHVSPALFKESYVSFLQDVRRVYTRAPVLVLRTFLGVMAEPTESAVREINAAGDAHVYYIDTDGWIIPNSSDYNDGAHPSDSGQAKVAAYLAPVIQRYLPSAPPHYV